MVLMEIRCDHSGIPQEYVFVDSTGAKLVCKTDLLDGKIETNNGPQDLGQAAA